MLIQPQDRNQFIMFESLDSMVSEENPIRLLETLIQMFIQLHPEKYNKTGQADTGRPAYSTETMLKIFMYGYMHHIRSSRLLEFQTRCNFELMWLTGNLSPDFKTIADFRKNNKELIKEFCNDVKKFLKANSLVNGKITATDGTKLKANAGSMLTRANLLERISNIAGKIDYYIEQSEIQDANEDHEYEINPEQEQLLKDEIDEQSKIISQKESIISSLQEELEYNKSLLEKMESTGRKYISETDQDCNMMKGRYGTYPGYNIQFTTDSKYKFIIGESVSAEANDINQLENNIKCMNEEIGLYPEYIIADKGYCNLDQIQKVQEITGTTCFVSVPVEQNISPGITFTYDKENNQYICSQGQTLSLRHRNKQSKNSFVDVYIGDNCQSCQLKNQCTKSKVGRNISRYWNQDWRQKYKEKMLTKIGTNLMKRRKGLIEHIMGNLTMWSGKIPLLTRGIRNVTTEIKLFSAAYNIKKLLKIFPYHQIKEYIEAYMRLNYQRTIENLSLKAFLNNFLPINRVTNIEIKISKYFLKFQNVILRKIKFVF